MVMHTRADTKHDKPPMVRAIAVEVKTHLLLQLCTMKFLMERRWGKWEGVLYVFTSFFEVYIGAF